VGIKKQKEMETKDKMERLLDMTEHPERYSEEEIQMLLEDDECREYYELMVKTDAAYTGDTSDVEAEKALQKFEAEHMPKFSWRKIAAIFIGILMISGIAYAAISLHRRASAPARNQVARTENIAAKTEPQRGGIAKTDSVAVKDKSFDNVELGTVLNEISAYYNLKVEYGSDKSKHLRLHFRWNQSQSAEEVVETLNHFENVHITLADGKMSVE
jgi:hypothetical protein